MKRRIAIRYSKPIQESINYIHANLKSKISLDTLADHAYFYTAAQSAAAADNNLRLFLSSVGEAPMKYVLRQRLRAAAQDLLSSRELNILDIAVKYNFESHDGFGRAFKKFFGINPGSYRKLNFQMGRRMTQNNLQELRTTMYDMKIYEKLGCSFEEKKEALQTFDKILAMAVKAKQSG